MKDFPAEYSTKGDYCSLTKNTRSGVAAEKMRFSSQFWGPPYSGPYTSMKISLKCGKHVVHELGVKSCMGPSTSSDPSSKKPIKFENRIDKQHSLKWLFNSPIQDPRDKKWQNMAHHVHQETRLQIQGPGIVMPCRTFCWSKSSQCWKNRSKNVSHRCGQIGLPLGCANTRWGSLEQMSFPALFDFYVWAKRFRRSWVP